MTITYNDYKLAKEEFVTGHSGSTLTHINIVSITALSTLLLYSTLRSRILSFPIGPTWTSFAIQIIILAFPLLLSVTVAGDAPGWHALALNSILLLPALYLYLTRQHKAITQWQSLPDKTQTSDVQHSSTNKPVIPQLPAVTTWRAHMMIMTILCILAVDFSIFPRALAKCETYGVSLMDLGVGSFVFSQGVVSALPMLKNPDYLSASTINKLSRTIRKTLPVLILGLIRVLLVKGSDYPEHTSEYGTHWNFFLTLALLPPLEVLLHPLIRHLSIPLIALSVSIGHQLLLSRGGLELWVATAPRTTLITHNKEGIISVPGYLALHLLGLSVGTIAFPPTPSYFRRHRDSKSKGSHAEHESKQENTSLEERQDGKTCIELCSYLVVYLALFSFAKLFRWGEDVSRQLANLQYVLWVTSYNVAFLLAYMIHDIIFFPSPFPRRRATDTAPQQGPNAVSHPYSSAWSPVSPITSPFLTTEGPPNTIRRPISRSSSRRPSYEDRRDDFELSGSEKDKPRKKLPANWPGGYSGLWKKAPPELLDAINRNSLSLFLLANLATGVINLSMHTMFASSQIALMVLLSYLVGLCMTAWWFKDQRLITF